MVYAAAPELHRFSVDPQAPTGIRGNGPDPEEDAAFVQRSLRSLFQVCAEGTQVPDSHCHTVEMGVVRVPKQRMVHRKADSRGLRCSGVDLDDLFSAGNAFRRALPGQDCFRFRQPVFAAGVPDIGPDLHIGGVFRNFPGQGKDAVRDEMELRPVEQLYAAVQAGTGIPAGVGLHTGVHVDGDPVFGTVCHQAGQIHKERRVAVVLQGGFAAVDVHRRVHHGAVNLQADAAGFPLPGNHDGFGIAGQSAGEVSHVRPGRSVRRDRCADHAVMGQVDLRSGVLLQLADGIQQPFPVSPLLIQAYAFHSVSSCVRITDRCCAFFSFRLPPL